MVIILYLLDRNVQTVEWNGQPLHEATKAEVEEVTNVSYTLKVDYPITDTEIYKKFQEDMLIIAPTPVTGRQLFRIKEISEQDDTVSLTCQHITEDIFKRSVRPIKVSNSTCQIALNAMISAVKTPLGKFSFTSNIMDNRTFNTTEDETLYKILIDGKHSIVGAWEGEMIRDNFLIDIPKSRGIDRGVVITTHQNLKQYERSKSSSSIITRLHLKSTFKPEGAKEDTVLKVTVDSPLIGSYPYINEAEYENNDLTTEEELRKWGEAKFKNDGIDKSTDLIKIEAYELDGQTVNLGDTATLMSLKHDIMLKKKAVGYVFDALSEEYISLTFDDKAGHGGGISGSNGISDVASEILDTVQKTQEDDEYYKKLKVLVDNANRAFEEKAGALKTEITDGIEQAKAKAEVIKEEINAEISEKIKAANKANKDEIVEEFKAKYNGIEVKVEDLKATANGLSEMNTAIQQEMDNFKASTASKFAGISGAQSHYEQSTNKAISDLVKVTQSKADRAYVEQTAQGIKEEFTSSNLGSGPNMLRNSRADDGLKYWTEANNKLGFTSHSFYLNGQKRMFELRPGAVVKSPRFIVKRNTDYILNILGFDNNSKYFRVYFCKRKKGSTADFEEKQLVFDGQPQWTDGPVFSNVKAVKKSFKFNIGEFDDGYLQFEYDRNNPNKWGGLFMTELDFYEGENDRLWQPDPEDATSTFQAEFEKTARGLETKITSFESYVQADGTRQETLKKYIEDKTASSLTAFRENIESGYISKSKYEEDSRGITRRFEELKTGGQNLVLNSGDPQNLKNWGEISPDSDPTAQIETNPLYFNGSRKLIALKNRNSTLQEFLSSRRFNVRQNTTYIIGVTLFRSENLKGADLVVLLRRRGYAQLFERAITLLKEIQLPNDEAKRFYFKFNSEIYDEAFLRFGNEGRTDDNESVLYIADVDVYEGTIERPWQAAEDEAGKKLETKLAEYSQTIDGELKKLASQIDDTIKKTDVNITPGQITFGVGKTINGKTISSLFVQDPESIALISKLIKVKGDMIVDGSILGRHLKTGTLETGHFKAGSVTSEILAANAVTADKVQVDYALISKLIANQAFIRELTSQRAFITQINSIDFSAERMQGGRLLSINKATDFNLNDGSINLYSNTGVIRRIDDTTSSEFIKLNQGGFIGERVRDSKAALIVIGTNHDKTENTENETFAGTRLYSGKIGSENESLYEVVSDRITLYSNGRYRSPWVFHNNTRDGSSYLIPMNERGVRHNLGRGDKHFSGAWIDNIFVGKSAYNVGTYLWDLLTCLGQISKYGWDLKNQNIRTHITGVLNKYAFK